MGIKYDEDKRTFVEVEGIETTSIENYRIQDFFYNSQTKTTCKNPFLIGNFAYDKFRKSNGFGKKSPAEGALRKALRVERQAKVCNSLQSYLLEFNCRYERLR